MIKHAIDFGVFFVTDLSMINTIQQITLFLFVSYSSMIKIVIGYNAFFVPNSIMIKDDINYIAVFVPDSSVIKHDMD